MVLKLRSIFEEILDHAEMAKGEIPALRGGEIPALAHLNSIIEIAGDAVDGIDEATIKLRRQKRAKLK